MWRSSSQPASAFLPLVSCGLRSMNGLALNEPARFPVLGCLGRQASSHSKLLPI